MKGYVPVDLPVKRYVKAYMEHHLGTPVKLDRKHKSSIIEKLFDILEKDAPPIGKNILRDYPAIVKVWLTYDQFYRWGATIRGSSLRSFNGFTETFIKEQARYKLDEAWKVLPGFDCHLPAVRDMLGITIEDWADDSIKKDYYRHRKRKGLPILKQGQAVIGTYYITATHLPFY